MKIRIEQRHIDRGELRKAHKCAAALAAQEQTGLRLGFANACALNGMSAHAEFHKGYEMYSFPINELANQWIEDFDAGKKVLPTIIDVPGLEDFCKKPQVIAAQQSIYEQTKDEAQAQVGAVNFP